MHWLNKVLFAVVGLHCLIYSEHSGCSYSMIPLMVSQSRYVNKAVYISWRCLWDGKFLSTKLNLYIYIFSQILIYESHRQPYLRKGFSILLSVLSSWYYDLNLTLQGMCSIWSPANKLLKVDWIMRALIPVMSLSISELRDEWSIRRED